MPTPAEIKATLETWWRARGTSFSGDLKWNEPLSKYTYYQIGGPAPLVAIPRTQADLELIAECIGNTGCKYFILGAGSNILISDEGYHGMVIRMGKMNTEIRRPDPEKNIIEVGAGALVSSLLRRAGQDGWGGLELLTGIPGTIGGAVKMNAGTHLGETQKQLRKVTVALLTSPLMWQHFEGEELKFQYRKNLFLPAESIVCTTEWEIIPEDSGVVRRRLNEMLARRKETQPIDYPSCGSVFKNPREVGMSAWQVLDRLGLRGHQIGHAQIAQKHSNFIINLGGAKASDVRALIELAKARAKTQLGVELFEEVIYVGP